MSKPKINWSLVTVKAGQLNPNPKNPKTRNEKGFERLRKSLEKFGRVFDGIVNKNFDIIDGHSRIETLGPDEDAVVFIPSRQLTQKEYKEFNAIYDVAVAGETDFTIMYEELGAEVLEEWNIDFGPKKQPNAEQDDGGFKKFTPETSPGDLFEIGNHRLICGDSMDQNTIQVLMGGAKADLAFNDPPYGMKKEGDGVHNDNLAQNKLLEFNREWIALQFQHIKENGSWYCWGIDQPLMDIYCHILKPYIQDHRATFRNLITWDKGSGQSQNSDRTRSYATADEKCLFIMMGVQGFNDNKDNFFEGFEPIRQYLVQERDKMGWNTAKVVEITGKTSASHYFTRSQWTFPPKKHYDKIRDAANGLAFLEDYNSLRGNNSKNLSAYEKMKADYYATRAYFDNVHDNMNNVWHFNRHIRSGIEGGHATPKPIPLCERAIKSSCPENGLVIDFFIGSGSTMVTAQQINRICYGIELDPLWCEVTVMRMLKTNPNIKVKRNGKEETKKWTAKLRKFEV